MRLANDRRATSGAVVPALADLLNLGLIAGFLWLGRMLLASQADDEPARALLLLDVGQACVLTLAAGAPARLLARARGGRWVVDASYALVLTALLFFLFCNLRMLDLMREHIEQGFLAVMLEPDLLRDLAISRKELALVGAALAATLVAQLAALAAGRRIGRARSPHVLGRLIPLATTAAATVTWLAYLPAWSYAPERAFDATASLPLFAPRYLAGEPLTALATATAPGGIGKRHEPIEDAAYAWFRRNLALPERIEPQRPYDVLFLVGESWRGDTLRPEVMPVLSRWASQRGTAVPEHYSTGTRSPESFFGLLSGLSPLYFAEARRRGWTPLMYDILDAAGYDARVYAAADLTYMGMDAYAFGAGRAEFITFNAMKSGAARDVWKARPLHEEDDAMVARYMADLEQPRAGRRLDVLYFYVTHFNYYYPPEAEVFRPALASAFKFYDSSLRDRAEELRNRYLNSAHYLDVLVGKVLAALERAGRLDHTVVVVTGDHGEEFFENGRMGHGSEINRAQAHVPLVVFLPGGRRFEPPQISSHSDVVPTVLDELGVGLPIESLFDGRSLLRPLAPEAQHALALRQSGPLSWELVLLAPDMRVELKNLPRSVVARAVRASGPAGEAGVKLGERARFAAQAVLAHKVHFTGDAQPPAGLVHSPPEPTSALD
jgi:hypothetical protein